MYQRILRTTCTRCIHNRDRPAVKRNEAELRIELQTFKVCYMDYVTLFCGSQSMKREILKLNCQNLITTGRFPNP